MKLTSAGLLSAAIAIAGLTGCGSGHVTVTPAGAVEDNFFVTWEIDSATLGPIVESLSVTPSSM